MCGGHRRDLEQLALGAVVGAGLAAVRLRSRRLRGTTSLACQPHAIVILDDHPPAARRAGARRRPLVFSIDKTSEGLTDTEVAFVTDFPHDRFQPSGRCVTAARWIGDPAASLPITPIPGGRACADRSTACPRP